MGVRVGVEADADIIPRSSADFDQGFLARERKSPSPPPKEGGDGEDGVRFAPGLESGVAVAVRANDRSATDL